MSALCFIIAPELDVLSLLQAGQTFILFGMTSEDLSYWYIGLGYEGSRVPIESLVLHVCGIFSLVNT